MNDVLAKYEEGSRVYTLSVDRVTWKSGSTQEAKSLSEMGTTYVFSYLHAGYLFQAIALFLTGVLCMLAAGAEHGVTQLRFASIGSFLIVLGLTESWLVFKRKCLVTFEGTDPKLRIRADWSKHRKLLEFCQQVVTQVGSVKRGQKEGTDKRDRSN